VNLDKLAADFIRKNTALFVLRQFGRRSACAAKWFAAHRAPRQL